MKKYICILLAALVVTACSSAPEKAKSDPANVKMYDLRGTVVAVDRAKGKATIDHKEIPGFMEPMTMDFSIREDWVWEDLKPGAEITATMMVDPTDEDGYWLENIAISAAPNPDQPPTPVGEDKSIIGKEVPMFTLTNQDGKRISPKDYAGKAWAVTFIYAQCPLPTFCIKMSTNFSDAAKLIMASENKDKFRLLTISFDPARDTPAKLKQYGEGYLGKGTKPDFSVWQLAVGPDKDVKPFADFAGLRYEVDAKDKAQFSHSLKTLVISPEGKVTRLISGNDWTGADLVAELKAASK